MSHKEDRSDKKELRDYWAGEEKWDGVPFCLSRGDVWGLMDWEVCSSGC